MNDFSKFNRIRNSAERSSDFITNVSEVSGENGFRCLHILWLYPDVMNIHGGRGDVMGLLHICNLLNVPVEIRRWDSLGEDVDWEWPHLVYMTAGELKCVPDIISALQRQKKGLDSFLDREGYFIANGSSGGVLADQIELCNGKVISGLGLLHMRWKERSAVWGDDIWVKTSDGTDVIGNQIQVADVTLAEGQEPFGTLVYGRGNDGAATADAIGKSNSIDISDVTGGSGLEGAKSGNVIYTGVLGPLVTKNPEFAASIITDAAENAGIEVSKKLADEDIEIEQKSADYIMRFMKEKMGK